MNQEIQSNYFNMLPISPQCKEELFKIITSDNPDKKTVKGFIIPAEDSLLEEKEEEFKQPLADELPVIEKASILPNSLESKEP